MQLGIKVSFSTFFLTALRSDFELKLNPFMLAIIFHLFNIHYKNKILFFFYHHHHHFASRNLSNKMKIVSRFSQHDVDIITTTNKRTLT